jgi:hypothetical protein
MIPASGAPVRLSPGEQRANVSMSSNNLHVISKDGFEFGTLVGIPQDVRITFRVNPQAGANSFGICVRGEGAWERGCELRFFPGARRVQYGSAISGGRVPDLKRNGYGSDFGIAGVDGLNEPFTVDMIVRDDFVDTCIDQRRTIITKRTDRPGGDRIFFFVDRGDVSFEDIVIRPLA